MSVARFISSQRTEHGVPQAVSCRALDAEVKSAFGTYRTALTQDLTEIEAADHDGMKIAHICR